ncbi:MAG: M48 family metalloprotease [Phycisphaerales bacterium]|nr:M48 family metalloprotease [Phycisphaerales bacterium]
MSHLQVIAAVAILKISRAYPYQVIPVDLQTDLVVTSLAYAIVLLLIVGASIHAVRTIDRHHRLPGRARRLLLSASWIAFTIHVLHVSLFATVHLADRVVPGPETLVELLVLAPMLLVMGASLWFQYPIERRFWDAMLMRRVDEGEEVFAPPGRVRFVFDQFGFNVLLVLTPIIVIGFWLDVVAMTGSTAPWSALWSVLGVLAVIGSVPLLMRLVLDTVILGPGDLRTRILGVFRAQRIPITNVLVWRTRGMMMNALIVGVLRPIRYVVLTDVLLESLSDDEIEAVTAHEVGHVRQQHMLWLAASILAVVFFIAGVFDLVLRHVALPMLEVELALSVVSLTAVLLVFGVMSRRFELQADAFAAKHLSGFRRDARRVEVTDEATASMIEALATVAAKNHMPLGRFTFRHGSIRTRIEHLRSLSGMRTDRLRIDRVVRRLQVAVVLGAIFGVGVMLW